MSSYLYAMQQEMKPILNSVSQETQCIARKQREMNGFCEMVGQVNKIEGTNSLNQLENEK